MVVVDFSEPSFRKRLYVVNLASKTVEQEHHVAHGKNSACFYDSAHACKFSNKIGSLQSSLGAMKTGKVYYGKNGKSLKLHGLEKGVNSNVFIRFVVIHPSNYVTDAYIRQNKKAGMSWGCLAVDPAISSSLIDLIKDGTFVYCYY